MPNDAGPSKSDSQEWFARHRMAIQEAAPGTLPRLVVTRDEYDYLKAEGKPWSVLADGMEMWGGVVIEVAS